MKKLIFITGEAWTGKSTTAEVLYQEYNNSAWLDGDDVWRVHPFSVEDERLRNSDKNMAYVINNYLASDFEYVFFTSIILCDLLLRDKILSLISVTDYELIEITLYADTKTLHERATKRDNVHEPVFHFLKASMELNTHFISTTDKSIDAIVKEMKTIIDS